MSKESISKSYMDEQKKLHGEKKTPYDRVIAITGASRTGSIGESIYDANENSAKIYDENVILDHIDFRGHTDLIMCHGYTYMDWLEEMDNSEMERIINVNLIGSIRMIKQFVIDTIDAPYRKKIISIGSMAYKAVLNGSAAYCASKAGLNHYIRCAAWELAPKGYDVYCINPSNVLDAPMTRDTINHLMNYRELTMEEALEYWGANNPRMIFLTKAEIVCLVQHLLYTDKGYMSGAPIDLAGGQR